jgi:hypothetical protein
VVAVVEMEILLVQVDLVEVVQEVDLEMGMLQMSFQQELQEPTELAVVAEVLDGEMDVIPTYNEVVQLVVME